MFTLFSNFKAYFQFGNKHNKYCTVCYLIGKKINDIISLNTECVFLASNENRPFITIKYHGMKGFHGYSAQWEYTI